jgi:predicted nucleotidyltransferase
MTLAKSLPTTPEALPGQAAELSSAPDLGGLPPQTLAQIQAVLVSFPQIRWLKLYGSRAMGNYRPGSDIDLAFSSPVDCTAQLAGAFEELPIPYLVDVTHWESLAHDGLRQHIEQVGILLN